MSKQKSDLVCGIFWDIENVSLPKSISINEFINSVRKRIVTANGLKELDLFCAANTQRLSPVITEQLNQEGFILAHVNNWKKNAADEKLKVAMTRFVDNHGDKSVIILISGDGTFVEDISNYKTNHCALIYIIFARFSASKTLLESADKIFSFHDLIEGIVAYKDNKNTSGQGNIQGQYLHIKGLPCHKDSKSIKDKLEGLVSEYGGKTLRISKGTACVEFKTSNVAEECLKHLEDFRIDGHALQASMSNKIYPLLNRSKKSKFLVEVTMQNPFTVCVSQIRDRIKPIISYFEGNIIEINQTSAWLSFSNLDTSKQAICALSHITSPKMVIKPEVHKLLTCNNNCNHETDLDYCFFLEKVSTNMNIKSIDRVKMTVSRFMFANDTYIVFQVGRRNGNKVKNLLEQQNVNSKYHMSIYKHRILKIWPDQTDDNGKDYKRYVQLAGLPQNMNPNKIGMHLKKFIHHLHGQVVNVQNETVLISFPTYKSCIAGFKNLDGVFINEASICTTLTTKVNKESLSKQSSLSAIPTHRLSFENKATNSYFNINTNSNINSNTNFQCKFGSNHKKDKTTSCCTIS